MVNPEGWVHEGDGGAFVFAGQIKGEEKPAACHFYLQQPDPFAHFAELTRAIDSLIQTNHAPYPVERTLLTTGVLDALVGELSDAEQESLRWRTAARTYSLSLPASTSTPIPRM